MVEQKAERCSGGFVDGQYDKALMLGEMFPRLVRFMAIRTGNHWVAEDLAGQTVLKALEGLPAYEERRSPFAAWLFRIAHNELIDYYRKDGRLKIVSIEAAGFKSPSEEENFDDPIEQKQLRNDVGMLPAAQRNVVLLRFYAGLSVKETAAVLHKRENNVKKLQSSGVDRLRIYTARREANANGRGSSSEKMQITPQPVTHLETLREALKSAYLRRA